MHSALFFCLVLYGVLVLAGGIIGYLKAKSRASLIAGIVFASLLGLAAGLVALGSPRIGAGLGMVSALALMGRFLPAFLRTKKVMPAGLVVAMGALVLVVAVLALVNGV
ncbi:MAG: TMEM14 family protein [Polyangiaceae bacterium]